MEIVNGADILFNDATVTGVFKYEQGGSKRKRSKSKSESSSEGDMFLVDDETITASSSEIESDNDQEAPLKDRKSLNRRRHK